MKARLTIPDEVKIYLDIMRRESIKKGKPKTIQQCMSELTRRRR